MNYLHYYNEISIIDSSTVQKPSLHMKRDISRSHYFTQVIEEYLNPSLEYLHIALNKPSEAVLATSLAWIKFFLGCLFLYVPDRPFDPAMKPMIDLDRHQKRKTELLVKLKALKRFESIFTGQDSNLRSQLVEQQIDALGSEPVMPSVPRPRISEVEQLQGEFNSLLKSIPFSSPKISDLRQVYQGDSAKFGEFELLRMNLAQCISRLSGKFRVYEDITRPLVAMLRGLDTGLAIALLKNPPTVYNNTIKFICELTPFLGMKLRNISTTTFHHLISYQTQDLDPRFFFLKTIALSKSANQKLGSSTMQVVFEIFHTFYHDWKAKLEADQRYEVFKSSMYRYRGTQDDFAEADENDYLKIFPDYISESEDSKKYEKPQFDQQKLTHDVANYQRAIFEINIAASEQLLTTLEDNASEISKMWPGESYIVESNMTAEHLLCGAVLKLSKTINRLSATATKTYNFYFDANLSEVEKLVGLVRRLQAKFQGLAEAWPEHATIQEVLQTSSELMAMRHTEPIAKILTKTEKLHSFVHEWQRVTSKEFSATDLYDQLSSLLISWRRLELSTWGQLLDIELTKCKEDADSWWFIAYEVIVAVPLSIIRTGEDLRTHAKHLFTTLEEFLQMTSIGQYSQRLHLIECFRQQLNSLAKEETSLKIIYNTLVSFLNYYSQFEKPIHNVLHAGRDALNKEMKEVLLLASWKDTNIVALRESAKRSHHQLFKIIRKYRAYLAQPAENFISKEFPQTHFSTELIIDDAVRSHESVIIPWAFKTCQQYLPDWGSKPVRFVDPLSTAKNILRISQSRSQTLDRAQLLNTYADDLIANIKLLQKETPEKATKENESIIKHLKNQKKKLYTDTLKDVRQMGFRSNLSVDTLMKQSSLAAVLVNSPAISADQLPPTFEAAEYDFHKLMHQMPYVRQQVRNHCEDLASRDVNKSIGLLESMLTLIIKQRNISTSFLSDLYNLDEIIKLMHNLEKPESSCILRESENRKNLRRETRNLISWLPSILDAGIRLIQNFDKLTQTDSTVVTGNLEHHKDKIQSLAKVYESLPDVPVGLSLSKHGEVDDEASQTLGALNTGIQNLSNDHPNLRFVLRQIEVWTTIDIDPPHNTIKEEKISLPDFDTKISKTLDSILVAIQQLGEIFTMGSFSPKDSGWLTNSESTLTSCLQVLHPQKIVRLLEAASSSIHRIESSNGNELSVAAALCALAMPILQQYRNALDNLLTCNVKFNTSLCRLTCVLAQSFCQVASEGFCSPADNSSAETGNTEKLEGTGLGEGSGAKDISQDIQNDEDLSELAEQPNKEKNTPEIEAQDKAVNMDQGELEGNLEETSSQREDGDSGSEGEEMDLDEESGKVDDLDPSAVDEKLWDGNTDKTQKEKEASQKNTGTKQNEQVAAEANETENDENDEMSDEMVEESEQVAQETEKLDPRLQKEQKLDLPEGMSLSDDELSSKISGSDEDLEQDSDDDDQNNLEDKRQDVTDDEIQNTDSEKDADDIAELEFSKESAEKLEEDADKTNIADTPSHIDPEEGDIIDQNLLPALPEDAHTGQDSNIPNGAQGLDQKENQQSKAQNQEANAQGEEKPKCSKAKSMNHDRIAEEAGSSQAEEKAENGQGQNSHPEESIRSQAIKKLGDALERWHRQHQEIQEANEVPREDYLGRSDNDMADQDFEHLNDEKQADTQALGAASQDQARALDERAYDTQMQDRVSEFMPDEVSLQKDKDLDDPKHSLESQADQEIPYTDSRTGALLVENDTRNHSLLESNAAIPQEEDEIDDLDTSLSITHLQPPTPRIPCSPAEALRLWTYYETLTHNLSLILTEQLRLILAPTLATKMRGDFRTGKRLNIKRIIPYIASNYKRDKIWMRRSVPSKRTYQILLAVDDSKSMSERSGSHLAFETLALLCKSLSMLEVGEISVVGFGTDVHVAHAFDKPFSADAGINVFQQFSFQQATTDVKKLLRESISLFRKARGSSARAGASDLWQLQLIISDGVCEDHESIRQLVRRAQEERIVIVFVIVDAGTNESILDMSQAVFETEDSTATAAAASAFPMEAYNGGGGEGDALGMRGTKTPTLKIKRYLDGFPFPYYLVVGDVRDLPGVLATALKQWFAEVIESH